MEMLLPFSWKPEANKSAGDKSVTVLVNRMIPRPDEERFTSTLKDLLLDFDRFPGTSGNMVFRREIGDNLEFSILQRFEKSADHEAWLKSTQFPTWVSEIAPAIPAPDHIHRYSGMESLFVTARAPDAPPRWKMAMILMIAVYPMSLVMSHWFAPMLSKLSLFSGSLLTSIFMVFTMTYVLVPILTRAFQGWLQPQARQGRSSDEA